MWLTVAITWTGRMGITGDVGASSLFLWDGLGGNLGIEGLDHLGLEYNLDVERWV